jgi:hypothetical protein
MAFSDRNIIGHEAKRDWLEGQVYGWKNMIMYQTDQSQWDSLPML